MKIFKNEHQNGWYSVGVSYWSIVIVRLIDFTIIALHGTTLMYFLIDHSYVDNGQFNWHRFTSFFLFLWMFIVYLQSMGQLLSLVFASLSDIAVAVSFIVYASIDFNNGYMFPYNHIVMMTSKIISDLIGSRIIKNGLVYSFYGIDRCDTDEISSVLIGHDIDPDTVYIDLYRIVINSIILRLLTLILMMFKLQGFRRNHHHWFVLRKKHSPSLDFIPIDYDDLNNNHESFNGTDDDQRMKSAVEIEFDRFAKNRIIIAWRSLSLFNCGSIFELRSATDLEQPKYILRNLNGQFRFGTLNALMGTSGAGKTSFLKVLNGRDKTRLSSETKFYLSKFTPLRTCYITQEISCHLTPGLSALQSLIYASRLKNLGENIDHKQKAMALLEELDIADTANTLVNKCSGGQRKRLALALELMSLRMPNFICIDEPTSGLDSNSAEVIVTCLRKMSHKHNITIVAAIHQPNTEMLMLFDQVYILARGGVCIFSGPPSQISDHLQQVCNDDNGDGDDKFAVEEMMKYSSLNHLDQQIRTLVQSTNESILDDQLLTDTQYILDGPQMNRTRFSLQSIRILIERQFYFYIGSPMARFLILAVTTFTMLNGLIIKSLIDPDIAYRNGCISLDEDLLDCNHSIEGRLELYISYQYANCCLNNFGIICFIFFAMIFTSQRKLFQIEHRNGWYSSGTFYVAKAISDWMLMIPSIIIYPFIVDIYSSVRPYVPYYMIIITILPVIAFQGASYILSILFGRNPLNLYISLPILSLLSVFCAMSPHALSHLAFKLLATFNLFRYQNEAILLLIFGFGRCNDREIQIILYEFGYRHDDYFYYCILMTAVNALLYQTMAITLFCIRHNPFENRRKRIARIEYLNQRKLPSKVIFPGLGCSNDCFTIKTIQ
ncbi:abc transporter-like protein 17 [Dermatophagoides farinae]|uniref:Abc transporter-like protein 17 n=1 Tax=Dermatophagoides farinae TaxID=6954 RepID=A0A9D4NSJ5_DERFA|nr:abc transporter-like protein 17 [Dermatophagoides farinae]